MLICVKDAFRQVLVDPVGEPAFGHTKADVVVVCLRCQFGWRSSPGFLSLFSSSLEQSHTRTTFQSASISLEGAAAVQHVKLVPPRDGSSVVPLPCDGQQTTGACGFASSSFLIRYCVDDGVLICCSRCLSSNVDRPCRCTCVRIYHG